MRRPDIYRPIALLFAAALAGCGDNLTLPQVPGDAGLPDAGGGDIDAGGEIDGGGELACPAAEEQLIACPDKGAFTDARAHWVSAGVIAWPAEQPEGVPEAASYELHYADCGIRIESSAVVCGDGKLVLTENAEGLSNALELKFPHLAGHRALELDPGDVALVPELLKGQLVLVGLDEAGMVVDATRVQTPGVIDELFTYDGPLGMSIVNQKTTFRLWAPTARWVRLHIYDKDTKEEVAAVDMAEDSETGVWSVSEPADAAWYGHYYKYEVYVFSPAALQYPEPEQRMVTDPYSIGLSENSQYSLIIDLADPQTKPAGWDELAKPALEAPEDIVVYEAHIRDFSIHDETVPAEHRGKYLGFTYDGSSDERPLSNGMRHLRELAQAGLTHLHLLPPFDIATVNEDPMMRVELDDMFDWLCELNTAVPAQDCTAYTGMTIRAVLEDQDPTTGNAQRIASYFYDLDGFNWGYDPFHYTAPEGSYATDSDGVARIVEFRAMVQALAQNGLRVVMDVVYNHTNASGLNEKSVLDRVVPGYYHRLNVTTGEVERSTCCDNTASEHAMMEKLMRDSLLVWAKQYKIDSFRFDLMGHHMKSNMLAIANDLSALTVENDGVDGSKIYVYGEGWNFGEVGNNARGVNATQLNMPGTGIGTFSDRLRDAVRGGGPFDGQASLRRNQGFISGMFYDPNEANNRPANEQRDALLLAADQIRVGMAGNLRDFVLRDRLGFDTKGSRVPYNGQPAGYTEDPQEVITYIEKHDNQTLWDINQYKLPTGTSMDTRVRVQNLGVSIVLLGQGVPFTHMGMDMLRSKSMERDSYNSGDWFNKVDFSYQTNNWNVGLPRADKDESNWPIIEPIIVDASIAPQETHIRAAAAHFREMLQVRKSSPLFRLRTKEDVMTRVDFHNVGPEQTPGLIVMSITDGICAGADLDPSHDAVLVLINANDEDQGFTLPAGLGAIGSFELHPVLANSADAVVRTASYTAATASFSVPARTTAVFVVSQGAVQGVGLPCNTRIPTGSLIAPVYVRGTITTPNWDALPQARLVADEVVSTTYTVDLPLAAGNYMFKVANAGWDIYNWGISGGVIVPGDGPHRLFSSAGDITLNVSTAGTYRFTLDVADLDNPMIRVDMVAMGKAR